jgi:hypothetical protein
MHRLSPLLFVIVTSAPLLAQSTFENSKASMDAVSVATYCKVVENYSDSQVPRIFAQITSAYGQSAGWVAFDSRATWSRAGRPKPVALVWYRDAKIVRVSISANDGASPRVYADYCYRQDGTLAQLRSVPSVQRKCEPSRYRCTVVLREERLYPPEGPVLTTFGFLDAFPSRSVIDEESLPAERIVENFVQMKWPEYLHVADLPFENSRYATAR